MAQQQQMFTVSSKRRRKPRRKLRAGELVSVSGYFVKPHKRKAPRRKR